MRGYLAGPMRGYPQYNFPAFFDWAESLRAEGHTVISPAEHDMELGLDWRNEGEWDLTMSIMWDLQQIADCDGIWLMPGWEQSRGCKVEVALAELLDKKIVILDADIPG